VSERETERKREKQRERENARDPESARSVGVDLVLPEQVCV